MNSNKIEIPINVSIEPEKIAKGLGSILLSNALEMLIGKRGLILPEFETKFWIGSYYVDIKMRY